MELNNNILLVGAGPMAIEYAKVLKTLKRKFIVIGRGKKSAKSFFNAVDIPVITGGIDNWLKKTPLIPKMAIVASTEETLGQITLRLLDYHFREILIEKPGSLDFKEIFLVKTKALKKNTKVYIAYNRRFYASVNKAREIIKKDGGVTSFHFEFTEWSHIISKLKKSFITKNWWFFQNSTHVIDLAFFLGGVPKEISSYTRSGLKWHPAASIFTGSGVTKSKALFSYIANWEAPGRWGLEIMTKKHRLIFRPLEKLQIQEIGSVEIKELKINNKLDLKYKPGLYKEVKSFLSDKSSLCSIDEQCDSVKYYKKILNQ